MKKKLLSLLMAGAMISGLVGCGSSTTNDTAAPSDVATTEETKTEATADASDTPTTEAGKDKITIWAWDEAFNIKAANVAKAMYQEENPDVEIEVVTMAQDDIVTKLNTSLSSSSYEGLPDIVLIEDYRIQGYLTAYPEEFSDLTDVAAIEDFATYKTGVNTIDGKLYGVPFDSGVAATFYRVDMIEEAGYTTEDMKNLTWEKYIEIGKAVQEKCGVAMCTLDPSDIGQIRMMMQSAGAWYTDAEGNVSIANNQSLKDSINVYKDLVDSGITKQVADWNQFVGAFNNSEVASVITGCWIAPSIKTATDQSGKWAVAEFPKMSANTDSVNASSIGGAGWYVLKNIGNEAIAKDFLSKTFASNVDLMNQLVGDISLVSTLNASETAENYSKPVEYFNGQEMFADLAKWTQEVPSVNYGLHTYALEDIMTEAVQQIVQGADVETVLSDYQTQAEAAVGQ